jgi:hypothetical protein
LTRYILKINGNKRSAHDRAAVFEEQFVRRVGRRCPGL